MGKKTKPTTTPDYHDLFDWIENKHDRDVIVDYLDSFDESGRATMLDWYEKVIAGGAVCKSRRVQGHINTGSMTFMTTHAEAVMVIRRDRLGWVRIVIVQRADCTTRFEPKGLGWRHTNQAFNLLNAPIRKPKAKAA